VGQQHLHIFLPLARAMLDTGIQFAVIFGCVIGHGKSLPASLLSKSSGSIIHGSPIEPVIEFFVE
jgi:hypothetical protein